MTHPLINVQRSMGVDMENLRLIADNIANSQTPGYQRKIAVQRTEFALAADSANEQPGDSVDSVADTFAQSVLAPLSIATDSSPGSLVQTSEPLDVALNGAGSLVTSTAEGEKNIRGGKLQINAQGVLVTQAGDAVLGTAGPITFSGAIVNHSDIEITADGAVKLSGDVIGQLRVEAPSTTQPDQSPAVAPRVMQGFVENSNVDSVTEMLKLMEVFRHFEASQKALRNYDGLLQQAISDLGKV